MATQVLSHDWTVTSEKVEAAIRALVEACDPLQIIAFGSRVQGDHRDDSDPDLAVILDLPQDAVRYESDYKAVRSIHMEVSLVVASLSKFDLFRPWRHSVFYHMDREEIVLYDRRDPECLRTDALHLGTTGRIGASVSSV